MPFPPEDHQKQPRRFIYQVMQFIVNVTPLHFLEFSKLNNADIFYLL